MGLLVPTLARRMCTSVVARPGFFQRYRDLLIGGTGLVGGVFIQTYLGTTEDFFEQRYVTKKSPDDVAEFYQAEDLIKMYAAAATSGAAVCHALACDAQVCGASAWMIYLKRPVAQGWWAVMVR